MVEKRWLWPPRGSKSADGMTTTHLDIPAEHAALLAELRAAGRPYRGGIQNDSYSGSGRPFLNVSAPDRRRIIKAWLARCRAAPESELLALADGLFEGETHEERTLGALMLQASSRARRAATPAAVERWLGQLNGWAEIDTLCASVFGPADLDADWPAWKALIERLGGDANINKRRAALVLLVTPTRTSGDVRFRDLGFATVERLEHERDILITKAVSWLLRAMSARHANEVAAYLDAHAVDLPAVALRETHAKLRTGRKSGRPRRN
jgi:3-methyladenine DNA glycosylase AlkD